MSLLYAKWTDPILGCMAAYSLRETAEESSRCSAQMAALNLLRYFPDLPDGHIVLGVTRAAAQEDAFGRALAEERFPVLARSVHELAAFADIRGLTGTWAQEAARRIRPRQPWSLTARAPKLRPLFMA